jgi:hypothetical protein
MKTEDIKTGAIVILIIIVIVLAVFLGICSSKKKCKEGLCLCSQPGLQNCVDRQQQDLDYKNGATENSVFVKQERIPYQNMNQTW